MASATNPQEEHTAVSQTQEADTSIEQTLAQNRHTANAFMVAKLEREAAKNWDKFYKRHQDKFFHDRHWTGRWQ